MDLDFTAIPQRFFGPERRPPGYLAARWLFLRGLGLIFFSAFYSLVFQIRGLIGPREFFRRTTICCKSRAYWAARASGTRHRVLVVIERPFPDGRCHRGNGGVAAADAESCPRGMLVICLIAYLSFIAAAQDFASYQSDGMLLEAGFISLFFAPPVGVRAGGRSIRLRAPAGYLLIWEMFRIYFESGIAKILGHDPEWRDFTAMDQYYQNGPLPTWIAWYAHQLPHAFHAATAVLTLALELVLIFAIFLPRRSRIVLFFVITPWQIGIILTSNYAFLNYIVLILGFLLLDDKFLARFLPQKLRPGRGSFPGDTRTQPASQCRLARPTLRLSLQAFSWPGSSTLRRRS